MPVTKIDSRWTAARRKELACTVETELVVSILVVSILVVDAGVTEDAEMQKQIRIRNRWREWTVGSLQDGASIPVAACISQKLGSDLPLG